MAQQPKRGQRANDRRRTGGSTSANWPANAYITYESGSGNGCPPADSVYAPGGSCGPDSSSSDSGCCGGGE